MIKEEYIKYFTMIVQVSKYSFIDFLNHIRDRYPDQPLALFMDNLSVHRARSVRQRYIDLNITPIFNVPYSPDYNGIEKYWFLIK